MNLAEELFKTIPARRNLPALLGPGDELVTYEGLGREIEQAALGLEKAGVRPGQVIGLHLPSGRDYIVFTYALWRIGAAVAPVPTELAETEKNAVAHEIALQGLIAQRRIDRRLFASIATRRPKKITRTVCFTPLRAVRETPPGLADLNPAFVRFTSGTTGLAKGVVLSHQSVWERIHAANDTLGIDEEDRVVWLLSMAYHFTVSIVSYLQVGAGVILCSDHRGSSILETAQRHEGTFVYGAPTHFELLSHTQGGDWPTLRAAVATTAALQKETARAFESRYGVPLGQALGIIEVGLPFISLSPTPAQRGSVGPAGPAFQVRLEDVSTPVVGGTVLLKGPGFFDAYYNPWRPRDEVLDGGWFDTGDVGKIDDDGFMWLTGRQKEVISVGGMKVFPQEVEGLLDEHPAVEESCAYGHKTVDGSEVVHAGVVLVDGQNCSGEALQDYLAENLALYKIPSRLEVVDRLSRTPSGKLIRDEARILADRESAIIQP
jgi:long-chain acyl-CoA synthetase